MRELHCQHRSTRDGQHIIAVPFKNLLVHLHAIMSHTHCAMSVAAAYSVACCIAKGGGVDVPCICLPLHSANGLWKGEVTEDRGPRKPLLQVEYMSQFSMANASMGGIAKLPGR